MAEECGVSADALGHSSVLVYLHRTYQIHMPISYLKRRACVSI